MPYIVQCSPPNHYELLKLMDMVSPENLNFAWMNVQEHFTSEVFNTV